MAQRVTLRAWFESAIAPYRLVAHPLPRHRPGVTHADGRFTPAQPAWSSPAQPTAAEQQRLAAAHAELHEKWVTGAVVLWSRPTATARLRRIEAGETDKRLARFLPLLNQLRFPRDPPGAWHHDVQVEVVADRTRKNVPNPMLVEAIDRYQAEHPDAGYAETTNGVMAETGASQKAVRAAMSARVERRRWGRPKV